MSKCQTCGHDAALAKNPEAVSKRLKEAEIASERPAEPMPTAGSNPASLDSPLTMEIPK